MKIIPLYLIFCYCINGIYGRNHELDINYDINSTRYAVKYELSGTILNRILLPKTNDWFNRVTDGNHVIWEGYRDERCEMLKLHPQKSEKPSVCLYIKYDSCVTFKQFDYRSNHWLLITEITYGCARDVNDSLTAIPSLNICSDEESRKEAEDSREDTLDFALDENLSNTETSDGSSEEPSDQVIADDSTNGNQSEKTKQDNHPCITKDYFPEGRGFAEVKNEGQTLWKARFRCEVCVHVSVVLKHGKFPLAKLRIKLHRDSNYLYFEKEKDEWKSIDKTTYYINSSR
ncbi:hypothetical protein BEWA_051800 [Theileria equi strain WA]|uniref:Signal peptide containing protein n=1 Tax=Theileria equi strain WA TaxID=1537102 RepID=L1LCQ9_THEEQ|nr:hypothetical protein BEWA_051800 [Theileria equi strain WA]EKX73126.1 hypothetical protein BEWA_051800 [Theileria equi strain WA]|eukprot:XP_004832578.1 hypothetical protein BEWA_051800 [Theileria equi strain WA]